MKEIAEAIKESIATDSIIHVVEGASDIYAAMAGIEYEDAIDLGGGHYDVWGGSGDRSWRLDVAIGNNPQR